MGASPPGGQGSEHSSGQIPDMPTTGEAPRTESRSEDPPRLVGEEAPSISGDDTRPQTPVEESGQGALPGLSKTEDLSMTVGQAPDIS